MICEGCGQNAQNLRGRVDPTRNRVIWDSCNYCVGGFGSVPDVYFKGEYVDEHLSSEEFPGPKLIRSRQDKKMWLDKCNLREAGDRVHGATSFDPISHRHAMESLRRKTNG